MTRNIHQRRIKNRKAVATAKQAATYAENEITVPTHVAAVASSVRQSSVAGKGGISQEIMDARVAELPWELKRIALFSAGVVLLLVILWVILR
jgi:hypothetical protein